MVKKKKKPIKAAKKPRFKRTRSFFGNRQTQTIIGLFIIVVSVFLIVSFISYLFNWQDDQSQLTQFTDKNITVRNLLGKLGANLSHLFIHEGFGVIMLYFPVLLGFTGILIFLKGSMKRMWSTWGWGILGIIWFSIFFGFFTDSSPILPGIVGYEVNIYLVQFLGKTGLFLTLLFLFISYLVIRFKLTPEVVFSSFKKSKSGEDDATAWEDSIPENAKTNPVPDKKASDFELAVDDLKPTIQNYSNIEKKKTPVTDLPLDRGGHTEDVEIAVEKIVEEKHVNENLSDKLIKDFGEFDPKLELGNYKFPNLDLLKTYDESISVDKDELEANKNRIVETLSNYSIGIARIKATVGPTVTLYEIVPEAGIRISKIKNLEDDIALSLSFPTKNQPWFQ
jgi:S-DNA-T family DNA segregation ATPase FtsK/SpoIIIE